MIACSDSARQPTGQISKIAGPHWSCIPDFHHQLVLASPTRSAIHDIQNDSHIYTCLWCSTPVYPRPTPDIRQENQTVTFVDNNITDPFLIHMKGESNDR